MEELQKYISTTKASKHWEPIGVKPHHGILVPLFSLRTKTSCGIGEYLDLIEVIDWMKDVGFDVLQLLPLNETGIDPSPYNAITSCALNPLHISLHALDGLDENIALKDKLKNFEIFNTYHRMHYLQLKRLKLSWLYEYYEYIFKDLKQDKEFEAFLLKHPWLEEYALYRAIQQEQNYKVWDLWPEHLKHPNKQNLPKLLEQYHDSMHFYFALQYLCFKQLSSVKKHADSKNILIQGDVPILVSRNSADVWFNRDIFDETDVAGAPPDSFSLYGQKWGFPLFNWKELEKTNYHWWKRRLKLIEDCYHMYRIDHVVGFFRIWAIPPEGDAVEGRFLPKDPALWNKYGRKRLEMMLESSKLLPIAEDLGLIPKIVYKSLKDLGICGTKVVPWERNPFGYLKFQNYEPLSVTTVSTHDSDTLQQWWEGYPKGSTRFAKFMHMNYSPMLTHNQRKEILHKAHHSSSIFHINLLQEYLALYPELVSIDYDDERINIPGTMLPTNWTYRYRTSFEEIKNHTKLNQDIRDILKD